MVPKQSVPPPAQELSLDHIRSYASHDVPMDHFYNDSPVDESIYDALPSHRKVIITIVLAFCGFLAPISSTTVLAAVPEVSATYHTIGSIINVSNALYMLSMGISPLVWGPLSQVYGRRWV